MSVNRITMSSAIDTLGTMFPNVDRKTLKSYIFKTNGHMERTVELLLQHQALEGHSKSTDSSSTTNQPPSVKRDVKGPLNEKMFTHTLSPDFLRFNPVSSRKKKLKNSTLGGFQPSGNQTDQIKDDELLARRMQEEFFREEKKMREIARQKKLARQQQQRMNRPVVRNHHRNHHPNQRVSPPRNNQTNIQHLQHLQNQMRRQNVNQPNARRQPAVQSNSGGGFNLSKGFGTLSEWSKKKYLQFKEKLKKKKTNDDMENQALTAPLNELEDGDEIELTDTNINENGVLDL